MAQAGQAVMPRRACSAEARRMQASLGEVISAAAVVDTCMLGVWRRARTRAAFANWASAAGVGRSTVAIIFSRVVFFTQGALLRPLVLILRPRLPLQLRRVWRPGALFRLRRGVALRRGMLAPSRRHVGSQVAGGRLGWVAPSYSRDSGST